MNQQSGTITKKGSVPGNIISWLFGIIVFVVGVINIGWGNDAGYGVFIMLLSFMYFPPVDVLIRRTLHFSVPPLLKIIVAIFIIWSAVGVGELFHKIDMMSADL